MRFFGFTALAAGALMLGACGGGNKNADTTAAAAATTTTAETSSTASAAAGNSASAAATPATGTATAAPVTGTVHEVKMIGDEKGYRFEPSSITIKAGDGLKFTNVSGGPHNIAFDPSQIPAAAQAQLNANMPNTTSPLTGPLLTQPNETYTISFAKVPPGTYDGHCVPHMALGMKISITVQ
jgi:plastocyanin